MKTCFRKENQRTSANLSIFITVILVLTMIQGCANPSFEKEMKDSAGKINETCPYMVDAVTRLDNANVPKKNVFQYNYTLINHVKSELDTEQMIQILEPRITELVRTSEDLKQHRKNKVTMSYSYRDKNGEFLFTINVTPDKYN